MDNTLPVSFKLIKLICHSFFTSLYSHNHFINFMELNNFLHLTYESRKECIYGWNPNFLWSKHKIMNYGKESHSGIKHKRTTVFVTILQICLSTIRLNKQRFSLRTQFWGTPTFGDEVHGASSSLLETSVLRLRSRERTGYTARDSSVL